MILVLWFSAFFFNNIFNLSRKYKNFKLRRLCGDIIIIIDSFSLSGCAWIPVFKGWRFWNSSGSLFNCCATILTKLEKGKKRKEFRRACARRRSEYLRLYIYIYRRKTEQCYPITGNSLFSFLPFMKLLQETRSIILYSDTR